MTIRENFLVLHRNIRYAPSSEPFDETVQMRGHSI